MTEREWREASDVRRSVVGIALVVTVGAALRFWSLGHGIPYAVGADEPEIMIRVVRMMRTGDFNPHFFDYPGLYFYLQLVVACASFLWGAMHGLWRSLEQVGPTDFYLWGRALTAALGSATVVLVYAIGTRWGSRHALLAAALMAVMPLHVRESHYVLTDAPMTFFVALAFLLALRAHERGTLAAYAWAGVAVGLGTATKYYAVLALMLPFLAAFLGPAGERRPMARALATLGGWAAAFLAGAPYTLLDLPGFLNGMAALSFSFTARPAAAEAGWVIYLKHLRLALGWPGMLLLAAGLALAWVRTVTGPGRARFAMLAVFPCAYFGLVATRAGLFARYLLPILPFISLLVGIVIVSGVSLLRRFSLPRAARTALIAAGTAAALLPPFVTSVKFDRGVGRPSTYAAAYQWIIANIPKGSSVTIETGGLRLPDTYRVEQVKKLVLHDYETYVARGTEYLVASSQAYGPAFEAAHLHAEEYAAYRRLFDQLTEIKRVPQSADPLGGPEIRVFAVRRR